MLVDITVRSRVKDPRTFTEMLPEHKEELEKAIVNAAILGFQAAETKLVEDFGKQGVSLDFVHIHDASEGVCDGCRDLAQDGEG